MADVNMKAYLCLVLTHFLTLLAGFGVGVYTLPILTAPPSPVQQVLVQKAEGSIFSAKFNRELQGSDFLHWGDGIVSLTPEHIVFNGSLSPGPDYKLYLLDTFVENEEEFLSLKDRAQLIGDIKNFNGFILNIPKTIDINNFTTIVIWCEAFSEFITAARYQ